MTQPARPPRRHFVGQLSSGTPTSASLDFTGRNILTAFLTLAFAFSAFSQTVSTEILGLVTDSTGAVIPGANVTAKRVANGDVRTTTTNETGNYVFPLPDIGEYEITCSVSGFKTELMHGIVLRLQEKARLNFQLQVGQQVETVEVSGATQLLRTEDATLGSVVESKRVVDLPLNGRNFGQLATLMPGVVIGSRMGFDGQGGIPIPGQMVAISANGQRDINQNATLDGVMARPSQRISLCASMQPRRIQSAERGLLGRIRNEFGSASQRRYQVRHEPTPRYFVRVCPERHVRRARVLPAAGTGQEQAAAQPVRRGGVRTRPQEQDILAFQLGGAPGASRHARGGLSADARDARRQFFRDPAERQPLVSGRRRAEPRLTPSRAEAAQKRDRTTSNHRLWSKSR